MVVRIHSADRRDGPLLLATRGGSPSPLTPVPDSSPDPPFFRENSPLSTTALALAERVDRAGKASKAREPGAAGTGKKRREKKDAGNCGADDMGEDAGNRHFGPLCKCWSEEGLDPDGRDGPPQAHTLKYTGVRSRGNHRWVAEIKDNMRNVRRWLGTFACPTEAAQAFDSAARAIRGPGAKTNFPVGHKHYVEARVPEDSRITLCSPHSQEQARERERDGRSANDEFSRRRARGHCEDSPLQTSEGMIRVHHRSSPGFPWPGPRPAAVEHDVPLVAPAHSPSPLNPNSLSDSWPEMHSDWPMQTAAHQQPRNASNPSVSPCEEIRPSLPCASSASALSPCGPLQLPPAHPVHDSFSSPYLSQPPAFTRTSHTRLPHSQPLTPSAFPSLAPVRSPPKSCMTSEDSEGSAEASGCAPQDLGCAPGSWPAAWKAESAGPAGGRASQGHVYPGERVGAGAGYDERRLEAPPFAAAETATPFVFSALWRPAKDETVALCTLTLGQQEEDAGEGGNPYKRQRQSGYENSCYSASSRGAAWREGPPAPSVEAMGQWGVRAAMPVRGSCRTETEDSNQALSLRSPPLPVVDRNEWLTL